MIENSTNLYAAFKAKDTRFDGKFFVAISSTGIYCRPICRAKLPKPQNCTFYSTASEAEQNGYRPCLLCRPELSPGNSVLDSSKNLARHVAKILDNNCNNEIDFQSIAKQLGCTERHLRRVFKAEYNVAPIQYLQTNRLLLAKRLLTETGLSITDVAMTSGFGSLRRFNALFKERYNLTPSNIRKNTKQTIKNPAITLLLNYRPPYLWQEMLVFLESRAIKGVELVENNEYCRTVHLVSNDNKDIFGSIRVGHLSQKNSLLLTISDSLLPVLPQVVARVHNLFDLYCEPYTVYEALRSMNEIAPNSCILGTRVPACFDPFEMSVRAILGQQISVKAASTLSSRIVERFGNKVDVGIKGLAYTFPTAQQILSPGTDIQNELGMLGVISARAKTIYALAKKIVEGDLNFESSQNQIDNITELKSIKGIGSWTANYIAMRTMGYTDAFLETDVAIKKALSAYSPQEMLELAEQWRPWRSYATINLWNTLK